MKMNRQFVVPRAIFLQFVVVALLVPTTKSFFGNTHSSSVNGKIDNKDSTRERKICSSTESTRKINKVVPSNDGVDLNERTFETQQNLDTLSRVDEEEGEGEGLVFEGKFNYQSDIIPIPTTVMSSPATDLFDFFSDPKNRDLVIKGGGNICERIPSTPELRDEWTIQSKIVNSTPPNGNTSGDGQNEEILAVYSEVPIVPGLSLRAISYTGCKTMKEPTSTLPYYEFTLLKETYQPVGKKAMTWIFDKITGNKNNNRVYDKDKWKIRKGSKNNDILSEMKDDDLQVKTGNRDGYSTTTNVSNSTSRKTYALSRVMLKPCPQDGGCKICYYGHVKLTLSKRFLHMLPLPTRVVQAKVNKSIRKQLECECTRSIQKFTGALNSWNERGESTSADMR